MAEDNDRQPPPPPPSILAQLLATLTVTGSSAVLPESTVSSFSSISGIDVSRIDVNRFVRNAGSWLMRQEQTAETYIGRYARDAEVALTNASNFVQGLANAVLHGGRFSTQAAGLNQYQGECAHFGVRFVADALLASGHQRLAAWLIEHRRGEAGQYMETPDRHSVLQDAGFSRVDPRTHRLQAGDVAIFGGHWTVRSGRRVWDPGHFCVLSYGRDGQLHWFSDCQQMDMGANSYYRQQIATGNYQLFSFNQGLANTREAELGGRAPTTASTAPRGVTPGRPT